MDYSRQLATHFKQFLNGDSFTGVNVTEVLKDITLQQATTKIKDCNTIATLVFHINYYMQIVKRVLDGGPLQGSDRLSFIHPPIQNETDWVQLKKDLYNNLNCITHSLEAIDTKTFDGPFDDGKYGNYMRNIVGLLEHSHYHLGQIALLKKLV